MINITQEPKTQTNLWVFTALGAMIVGIFAASGYAVFSLLGRVPMSWGIFFSLTGSLLVLNTLFLFAFWLKRNSFSIRAQLVTILWGGLATWYWSFAPLYFFLTTNVNLLQLKWTAFAYLWEVPIVGGLFIAVCLWIFHPIASFMEGKGILPDASKLYQATFHYSILVSAMMTVVSIIGYVLGTAQIRFFAFSPSVEQLKNIWDGAVISLFLGVIWYLTLDVFLVKVRSLIRQKYPIFEVKRKRFYLKILGVTLVAVMGSFFLILLLVFQSFQIIIKDNLTLYIKKTIETSISKLEGISDIGEAAPILDDLKFGERGQILMLDIGQELPTENFSEESRASFLQERSGITDDFKKDLKLVAFFEAPLLHKKIASIVYLSDFYKIFNVFGGFFMTAGFFVLIPTIGVITFMVMVLTRSVNLLSTAIKETEISGKPFAPDIQSGDEFEELSRAFLLYIRKLEQVHEELEAKVKDRTKELSKTVGNLEGKNEEMERNKGAMLNLREDEREAETKIKQQSEDLKKAFEDVQKFASVADQERNMYFLLLSSIGEGVLALDPERKITISNEIAEKTLGFTKEEISGKKIDEVLKFIHVNKEPLEESFWHEAFAGSKAILLPADISVIGKGNKVVPIVAVASAIKNVKTKEVNGIIITFRDIREERALDEARISFISVASHQLRTPLTSMRWFSEMLISGDAGSITEEQKHFVERIYEGTERMINLVNLLLQIARVEAGRVKIEPAMISFKNLLKGISVALRSLLDVKSQQLDVKTIPDPFPEISMDQEVVWQVFQNLLSNAIRYSPEKSVISVLVTKKGDFAEVVVKDSGIGIPKAQQDRIFEKFFRAENALKLVPEGSGLGLSLVKGLVDGWGGKVWFESEEGRGTRFYFTIPMSGMKAKEGDVKLSV